MIFLVKQRTQLINMIRGLLAEFGVEIPKWLGAGVTDGAAERVNAGDKQTPVLKRMIPLVLAGTVTGREPNVKTPTTIEVIRLPGHAATMDDCCRILEMTLGAPPAGPVGLTVGILEILSLEELSVTAVYTATNGGECAPSIDVQQVTSRIIEVAV